MDFVNKGLSGIVNVGNTCYMNSVIQCISHTHDLTKYILTNDYQNDVDIRKKEYKLTDEYIRILKALWSSNCTIKPVSFKVTLAKLNKQYANTMQQDSHEFLIYMIDIIHKTLSYQVNINYNGNPQNDDDNNAISAIKTWSDTFSKEYSYLTELFYGQYHSELKCDKCENIFNNFDPFCYLSLPINGKKTLDECFDEFTKKETLDVDNKWKCGKCNENTSPDKKIYIWSSPKMLIIQLKRFDYMGNKLNHNVTFPLDNLDISKYSSKYNNNTKYELYATCNHLGGTNGGHYVACCKNDDKWYNFDDQNVSLIKDNNMVINNSAYLLFYKSKQ